MNPHIIEIDYDELRDLDIDSIISILSERSSKKVDLDPKSYESQNRYEEALLAIRGWD